MVRSLEAVAYWLAPRTTSPRCLAALGLILLSLGVEDHISTYLTHSVLEPLGNAGSGVKLSAKRVAGVWGEDASWGRKEDMASVLR